MLSFLALLARRRAPSAVPSAVLAALLAALVAASALPAAGSGLSGAYLAAMQADFRNDYPEAAAYYDKALALDPENAGMLTNALVSRVAMGDLDAARALADRLEAADPATRWRRWCGSPTRSPPATSPPPPASLSAAGEAFNPLLGGLLAGWVEVGQEDFDAAKASFDAMTGNDALAAYGQYHKALALAFAGDFVSAEAILAGGEDGPLHLNRSSIVAHAEVLAQIGREADAVQVIDDAMSGGLPDAPLLGLRDRLAAGEEVPFDVVTRPRDGAAEAFLTLADALNNPDSERVALLHARLAAAHPPRPHRGADAHRRHPRGRGAARARHRGAGRGARGLALVRDRPDPPRRHPARRRRPGSRHSPP